MSVVAYCFARRSTQSISYEAGLKTLFPIGDYWFIAVYLCLMVFASLINEGFDRLSQRIQCYTIVGIIVINSLYSFVFDWVSVGDGYSIFQGLMMYLIGRYCSENGEKNERKRKWYLSTYFCISIFLGLVAWMLYNIGQYKFSWKCFSYNNPLVIMSSITLCLFVILRGGEHKALKTFSKFSPYCLSIYLISDYSLARGYVFMPFTMLNNKVNNCYVTLLIIFVTSIAICCTCMFAEAVRRKIIKIVFKSTKMV